MAQSGPMNSREYIIHVGRVDITLTIQESFHINKNYEPNEGRKLIAAGSILIIYPLLAQVMHNELKSPIKIVVLQKAM